MRQLPLEHFLSLATEIPVIDVRSPGEFEQGRLPNSHNMPLLDNEERVIVGTIYKQVGPKEAFKIGLEFIGPKMSGFIDFAEKLGSEELLVHCWRGGQRSQSVATLLSTYGFKVNTLSGGYKTYRQAAINFFNSPLPITVLTGYTGSRKTEVLHELAKRGEQVIDLEGLANHQGSAFGRQPSEIQPSVEQFQNMLFEEFRKMDLNKRIWLEDESMRIGGVNMTQELYQQKNAAPCVFMEIPIESRIQNLVSNYGKQDEKNLIRATKSIQKKLGIKEAQTAIEHIKEGNAEAAAAIILKYYDKRYSKSIVDKSDHTTLHLTLDSRNPAELAEAILDKI